MLKYIVGAVGIIVVLAAAYYFFMMPQTAPAPTPEVTETQQPVVNTYATSTYSIQYPPEFMADENYAYDQFGPEKLIHGVKFTVPEQMATGTNLSNDSYIAVEQLPRAQNCTADIYLKDDVRAVEFTENGVAYSVATTSGAGAGNFYEEMVYALKGSSPCTAVRYMIHSTNIGNYEPGAVMEFNRDALLTAFDSIRQTLQVMGQSMPQMQQMPTGEPTTEGDASTTMQP